MTAVETANRPEPKVGLIILNWNRLDDTLECLESVAKLDYGNYETIVVDNGSRTDPVPAVERAFPSLKIIANGINLGYAGGNNVGIRYFLERGVEYVVLLNNDSIVDPTFLTELVRAAQSDPSIAALGPKVLQYDNRDRIYAVYGKAVYGHVLVKVWGWNQPRTDFADQKDVGFVVGSGMMMSAAALKKIGLLDEEFFAYHEDVDWCECARQQGMRVVYVPSALQWHKGSASTGGGAQYVSPQRYLLARNTVLYAKRHANIFQWIKLFCVLAAFIPAGFARRTITRELAGYRLRLGGFRDGFLGRPIPFEELGLREEKR